jgi:Rieske Fe-S protein
MQDAKLHCSLHGSDFDFSGNVTNGPAKLPLRKFPVTIENGNAVILLA